MDFCLDLKIHERVNRVLQQTNQLKEKKRDCIESLLAQMNELKIENRTLSIENNGLKNENKILRSTNRALNDSKTPSVSAPRVEPVNLDSEVFTYDFIKNTMRTIGSRVLDCKKDFHPLVPDGQFLATNSNGVAVFACNSSTTNKSKLLLYGVSQPVKSIEFFYHLRAIGLSLDTIYIAYYVKSLAYSGIDSLKIESYSFDLCRKTVFTNSSQLINEIFPSIDIEDDKIHLKMRVRSPDPTKELYRICILNRNLVETDSFSFSEPFLIYDIKIRKDKIAYHSRLIDNRSDATMDSLGRYVFHLKSLKTKDFAKQFTLIVKHVVHYGMSFDIGPNENIFMLDGDKVLLSECDSNGNFLQTVKLKMEPSTGILQVTENFNFFIYLFNKKAIYLNWPFAPGLPYVWTNQIVLLSP
jgi:hypothetical protein